MSKLGIHAITGSRWVTPFAEAGASVIKVVDNVPWARGLASAYKSAVVVERVYTPMQLSDVRNQLGPDPKRAAYLYARQFFLPFQSFRTTGGAKTYVETINEPVVWNAEDATYYAQFGAESARIHLSEGYGSVLGCFATGNPELNLWRYFGAWAEVWNVSQDVVLGLHEYGHWAHLPGFGAGQDSWNMLRYKRVQDSLKVAAMGSPRIIITETGLDEVGGYPEASYQQWRTPDYSEERFLSHMQAYDAFLMSDPRVIGATIFTYNGGWPGFDMEGRAELNNKLIQHIRNTKSQNMMSLYTPVPLAMGYVRLKTNLNVRSAPWINTAPPVIETLKAGTILPYYDKLNKCGWLMLDIDGNKWCSGLASYVEYL